MAKKNILGLDLGTNSIGWALVEMDAEKSQGNIIGLGSRIIPMTEGVLGKFGDGTAVSQTAKRTWFRSVRRLRERYLLRRERLHRVLNILNFLPPHYVSQIDFDKKFGKFKGNLEPKITFHDGQFIFQDSFEEMLDDFRKHQPELVNRLNRNGEPSKVPYDWTVYFLRKKALTEKISKEELAWLILNFNQKRGYYQLRGEDEFRSDIREYVEVLRIVSVVKGEVDRNNPRRTWYNITLSNGWVYRATFYSEPLWLGQEKEFLITEEIDENGDVKVVKDKKTDISGKEKRRITPLPSFDEIDLMSKADQDKIYKKIKAKTEITIQKSGKTVGTYIYDCLLSTPEQKIRGKLVRTIERKFYKEELGLILKRQLEFHPELQDRELLLAACQELYRNNTDQQELLGTKDFVYLLMEDIIFFQRPLKSNKSTISNCPFEQRKFKDKEQVLHSKNLKVTSKSNPYYQEFRIWQWLQNLKFYFKATDEDVTRQLIRNISDYEGLFEFLMSIDEVDHRDILRFLLSKNGIKGNALKTEIAKYRWNYVYDVSKDESKRYPCNKTRFEINKRLQKVSELPSGFLTNEIEYHLWHIIYSVTDKGDYKKAIETFARKYSLDVESFVAAFNGFPPFRSDYGAYSEKALRKLLPLMRAGRYWNWNDIDEKTRKRIEKIITGEFDESIKNRIREKALNLTREEEFQGLPLWLSSYIVYDRHAEAAHAGKWISPNDLEDYLNEFKQHSLRNPIVEQVITETLRVVKDIWVRYGKGEENFFDEIHIELGREMKNSADERKRISSVVSENENTNRRIQSLLMEFMNDREIEGARAHSPYQQELLKIYEDGVLKSGVEIPDYVSEILKKFNESDQRKKPTSAEVTKYKLWLEQKYRSPYTGQIIPLNKLFTNEYNIEHVIPQSRYFDDSLSNKVICETAVNSLKDNSLGMEFIKNHHGEMVTLNFGRTVQILNEDEYTDLVNQNYASNQAKRNKLLLTEIPDAMVERQMNDTRYISKYVSNLLSNVVRSNQNDDGLNSKNVIPGNGKVTSILKKDWGLNDVWNAIILPRFERINRIMKSTAFTSVNKEGHVIPAIPFEYSKDFQKKRIDHRHHAMDALVIACATRDHINLLNNQSAKSDNTRYDLQHKLRNREQWTDSSGAIKYRFTEFKKPWPSFPVEAKAALESVIVSFKQNTRVINKASNYYYKWVEKDGHKKKIKVKQEGVNWAIRKPLHQDTVNGLVLLPHVKVEKGKILTATRKTLDATFDLKSIESITDLGIQKILMNYLKQEKFEVKSTKGEIIYDHAQAFSPEGIDFMNRNIEQFNGGKKHKPIVKVRVFEQGSKFPIGTKGNKPSKYVEAAKGTNLFFAIYQDARGKRSFKTIPFNEVVERQKQGLLSVPDVDDKGNRLVFWLSPYDLVYLPTLEEIENVNRINLEVITKEKAERIFVVNDFSSTCYFMPNRISKAIVPKEVDMKLDPLKNKVTGSYDTKTASFEGKQIKEFCIKLSLDRLGKIKLISSI
jgi:CRISPR-associated endonuclease Csn1